MISACATSQATKPLPRDPDPIVETRTITRTVCPAELRQAPLAKPARPNGWLEGNAAMLAWVGELARWGDALFDRQADAAKQCS